MRRYGRRARQGAGEADAFEFVTEAGAVVDRCDVERHFERHSAREHEAAQHVGRKSRPLLVGEERHDERAFGHDAVLLQRLGHFQPGQDSEIAVVAAARAHGVDVRARHDRCGEGIRSRSGGEHVADRVDGHARARGPASTTRPTRARGGRRRSGRAERCPTPPPARRSGRSHRVRRSVRAGGRGRYARRRRSWSIGHARSTGSSNPAISASAAQNASTAASKSSSPRSAVAVVGSPMWPSGPKSFDSHPKPTLPPKRT